MSKNSNCCELFIFTIFTCFRNIFFQNMGGHHLYPVARDLVYKIRFIFLNLFFLRYASRMRTLTFSLPKKEFVSCLLS